MPKRKIKQLKRTQKYQNPWITVYEDAVEYPDGSKGIYGVVHQKGGLGIIAKNTEGKIYMIKEHGYPCDDEMVNLPGGHLEEGLTPLENAKRELFEETGLRASTWTELGWYYTDYATGPSKEYVFIAQDLDDSEFGLHQEGIEAINEIITVTEDELKDMIRANQIKGSFTLSCLSFYFSRL